MLRVAALQIRTCANRIATLNHANRLVANAAVVHGARLVCLPESFTGEYGVDHFANNAERWLEPESGTLLLSQLAAEHGIYVCGGVIEHDDDTDELFNTIAAFGPDGVEVARYRKMHLSRVVIGGDSTSEDSILTAGDELSWFDVEDTSPNADGRGWRVGLQNCFDLRFNEAHAMLTDLPPRGLGSELVLYPSSWLKSTGDLGHWETLLRARALDGQCFVLGACNARDDTQDTVAFGRSCIVGPLGETLAVCNDDTMEEVVVADLDLSHLVETRNRIPLATSRRPVIYNHSLTSLQQHPTAMSRPLPPRS
eukprot:m.64193 g.64193  ORF g.64193 m.64193 type:complete len:310 (-) comp23398_c0_seq1:857-1786(-)